MKNKRREIFLLILLIGILITMNYNFFDSLLNKRETAVVERVIDGDTFVVNGTSVRLLGMNSPERGEKYYLEAKE